MQRQKDGATPYSIGVKHADCAKFFKEDYINKIKI